MVKIEFEVANEDLDSIAAELTAICDKLADRMTKGGPRADHATTTYTILWKIRGKLSRHSRWLKGQ